MNIATQISENVRVLWELMNEPLSELHAGDLVVLKDQVLFGDGLEKKATDLHIALSVGKNRKLKKTPLIAECSHFQKMHKHFLKTGPDYPKSFLLEDAIRDQLLALDELPFALSTPIIAPPTLDIKIDSKIFDCLVADSSMEEDIEIEGSQLYVRDLSLKRRLWSIVYRLPTVRVLSQRERKSLRSSIFDAFDALIRKAHTDWGPASKTASGMSALDYEIRRWQKPLGLYKDSLLRCRGDANKNFADFQGLIALTRDYTNLVLPFIIFYGSMCNLYPLLHWLTCTEQAKLRMAFNGLPWDELGEKEGYAGYRKALKDILRSPAVESVSSDKALKLNLRVKLGGIKVSYHYLSKSGQLTIPKIPSLRQLPRFTNEKQAFIPASFWFANQRVIECSINFLAAMRDALSMVGAEIEWD